MTTEQVIWGLFAILLVFLLNQIFGRLFGEWLSGRGRPSREHVTREEHTMCTRHTAQEFALVRADLERVRVENREGHEKLHGKIDGLTALIRQNGFRDHHGAEK